jgi:glycine/D-amino acid oxidase-like deaminating enzyme
VVIAAGPWSAGLAEPAGVPLPLEPRKGQLVLLNGSDPLIRHKVVDGPVTGRLIAQLYCGEPPVVDPAPFDPDRFGR